MKRLLVNEGERKAWRLLNQHIRPDEEIVLVKVRLADVFEESNDWTQDEREFLLRSHLDFLVCDRRNLAPRFAVEFDEPYHSEQPEQKRRDELKNRILQKRGLKLVRLTYDDIRSQTTIAWAIKRQFPPSYHEYHDDEEFHKFDEVIKRWNPGPGYVKTFQKDWDFRAILNGLAKCKQIAVGLWPGGWYSFHGDYKTSGNRIFLGVPDLKTPVEIIPTAMRIFNFQHRLDAQFIGLEFGALPPTGIYDFDLSHCYFEEYALANGKHQYPRRLVDESEIWYQGELIRYCDFGQVQTVFRYIKPGALVLYPVGSIWQRYVTVKRTSRGGIGTDQVALDLAYRGEQSGCFHFALSYIDLEPKQSGDVDLQLSRGLSEALWSLSWQDDARGLGE